MLYILNPQYIAYQYLRFNQNCIFNEADSLPIRHQYLCKMTSTCCQYSVVVPVCPSGLKEAVEDVLPSLREQGVTVLLMTEHCDTPGIQSFSDKVDEAPGAALPRSLRSHITFKSPAVYIYTSGTTGIWVPVFVCLIICIPNIYQTFSIQHVCVSPVSEDSLRQLWSIRTASSQLWLFYLRTVCRLVMSST